MAIPLDPGCGGRCIAAGALSAADIIVSTADGAVSFVIRTATWSEVSHAALYVGNDAVIEAVGSGIRRTPLAEAVTHDTLAVAYRWPGITTEQAQAVVEFASKQAGVGKKYDYIGAVGASRFARVMFPLVAVSADITNSGQSMGQDRFFCSELVVAAFRSARINLVSHPASHTTLGEIASLGKRNRLEYVGHLKAVHAYA
jgi:hypothetical protein